MKERPILFSAPMVRAILDGRKTQTRRVVKEPAAGALGSAFFYADKDAFPKLNADPIGFLDLKCPYGVPGDRLWVRETFVYRSKHERYYYRADHPKYDPYAHDGWKPSIHMPRKASRITLEVTHVRVERLLAITEADAIAEGVARERGRDVPAAMGGGVETWRDYLNPESWLTSAVDSYRSLWDSISTRGPPGPHSWVFNPWVWVVEFKRVWP